MRTSIGYSFWEDMIDFPFCGREREKERESKKRKMNLKIRGEKKKLKNGGERIDPSSTEFH